MSLYDQTAYSQNGPVCAENRTWISTINGKQYQCVCIDGHVPDCTPISNSGGSIVVTQDPKVMITGMIFQSLLNSLMTSNAQNEKDQQAAQQAELERIAAENAEKKRIQDSIAFAKHKELIGLYKPLDGTSINTSDNNFKTLDSEMEQVRKNAQDQFGNFTIDNAFVNVSQGTNFFGSMSDSTIQLLFNPLSDPMVVDLSNTQAYFEKTSTLNGVIDDLKKNDPSNLQKKLTVEECTSIQEKLDRDIKNRNSYIKTINTTLNEIEEWKEVNNKAMLDAFTEGLDYFTGKLLDQVNAKKEKAELLKKTMQEILKREPNNIGAKNLIQFLDKNYLDQNWRSNVINGCKKYISLKEKGADLIKYYEVTRDALKNTLDGLSSLDKELMTMMNDPSIKSFLDDEAFMNSCVFIGIDVILTTFLSSEKVNIALNKAFSNKIPYVAIAQSAVNLAYDGFAYWTSWCNLKDLKNVHGKELETAQMLQDHIFINQIKINHQCPETFIK